MKKLLLFSLALFSFQLITAQPFTRDTTFSVNYPFHRETNSILGMLEEPDGSFLLYGRINDIGHMLPQRHAVKFFANGELDQSFVVEPVLFEPVKSAYKMTSSSPYHYLFTESPGGIRKTDASGNEVNLSYYYNQGDTANPAGANIILLNPAIAPGAAGELWAGCQGSGQPCIWPSMNNVQRRYYLFRLNPQNWYDTTFTRDVDNGINAIVPYNDSLWLITGKFSTYDGMSAERIIRIDRNGNVDPSFQGIFMPWNWDGSIVPLHIQADGKIIVSGSFRLIGHGAQVFRLIRLMPNGQLDPSFNNTGFSDPLGDITTVCPTSDGGFLFGGRFDEYQSYARGNIVKTDQNGFIEPTYFNHTGFDDAPAPSLGILPSVYAIVRGTNDMYYAMGWFNSYDQKSVQPVVRFYGPTSSISESKESLQKLQIYPNPAQTEIKLIVNGSPISEKFSWAIRNLAGQTIHSDYATDHRITLPPLADGCYIISVNFESFSYTGKLIIRH